MQPAQQPPPAYQHGNPQQQTTIVQQQPVVTLQPALNAVGAGNQRGNWCWRGIRVTGYLQTILAILAVGFGIAAIFAKSWLYYIGTPIWCGLSLFLVAGILGIAGGHKRNSCMIIGYMVMSILSTLAAFGVAYVAGVAIPYDRFRSCSYYFCSPSGAQLGIDGCLLVIAIAEFVISIVGASLTCCGLQYNGNSAPQTVVTYQTYPQQMVVGAPPQGVYINSGATVAYPNQVVLQPGQTYQPQGQFQPLPQGQQFQPLPQGQFQPQLQEQPTPK
ncbi:membrane-spanning 4-domains subfamily A member 4A-like [Asterias amurensis]|uniref:membrane-spanning 4-domains subfamily A member 4A-like n=1 Tax=Asterias amurensis TaxID=7602 RepID=UPI003AB500B1